MKVRCLRFLYHSHTVAGLGIVSHSPGLETAQLNELQALILAGSRAGEAHDDSLLWCRYRENHFLLSIGVNGTDFSSRAVPAFHGFLITAQDARKLGYNGFALARALREAGVVCKDVPESRTFPPLEVDVRLPTLADMTSSPGLLEQHAQCLHAIASAFSADPALPAPVFVFKEGTSKAEVEGILETARLLWPAGMRSRMGFATDRTRFVPLGVRVAVCQSYYVEEFWGSLHKVVRFDQAGAVQPIPTASYIHTALNFLRSEQAPVLWERLGDDADEAGDMEALERTLQEAMLVHRVEAALDSVDAASASDWLETARSVAEAARPVLDRQLSDHQLAEPAAFFPTRRWIQLLLLPLPPAEKGGWLDRAAIATLWKVLQTVPPGILAGLFQGNPGGSLIPSGFLPRPDRREHQDQILANVWLDAMSQLQLHLLSAPEQHRHFLKVCAEIVSSHSAFHVQSASLDAAPRPNPKGKGSSSPKVATPQYAQLPEPIRSISAQLQEHSQRYGYPLAASSTRAPRPEADPAPLGEPGAKSRFQRLISWLKGNQVRFQWGLLLVVVLWLIGLTIQARSGSRPASPPQTNSPTRTPIIEVAPRLSTGAENQEVNRP